MMMRNFILILCLININSISYCQTSLRGKYSDHFGYSLELKEDGSYEFNYRFDLASGWAIGTWTKNGNIINLTPKPVMDTLSRTVAPDSLVLSLDMVSERIFIEQFAIDQISSGGQLPDYAPKKLLYKKDRLYTFDKKGKVKRNKVRGLFTRKKFDPWYFKTE